jgi:hypothetical protein
MSKKFLIIANKNSANYLTPLVKNEEIWLGYSKPGEFYLPDGSLSTNLTGLTVWWTNIDLKKRHIPLLLCKEYIGNESEYPMYDNYNAINVNKVCDIPKDYLGYMGVPITYLNQHCPDQFEIIGITYSKDKNPDIELIRTDPENRHTPFISGKGKFPRVIIKRK